MSSYVRRHNDTYSVGMQGGRMLCWVTWVITCHVQNITELAAMAINTYPKTLCVIYIIDPGGKEKHIQPLEKGCKNSNLLKKWKLFTECFLHFRLDARHFVCFLVYFFLIQGLDIKVFRWFLLLPESLRIGDTSLCVQSHWTSTRV